MQPESGVHTPKGLGTCQSAQERRNSDRGWCGVKQECSAENCPQRTLQERSRDRLQRQGSMNGGTRVAPGDHVCTTTAAPEESFAGD